MNAPVWQRVKTLLDEGKLEAAEAMSRDALALEPGSIDMRHVFALVRARQGATADAEALLRGLVLECPSNIEIRFNFGNLLRRLMRMDEAASEYHAALQQQPAFRPARLALLRLFNQVGRPAEAELHAQQLLSQDPADAEAHAGLGVALRALGRYAESEAAYRKALAIKPNYAVARHNLGALLSHLERAEESLAELQRAARDGAGGTELHFNCARALIDMARFEEAESELLRLIRLDPAHVQGQVMLAKLRFARADRDCARDLLATLERQPAVELYLAAAQVSRGSGALVLAEDLLTRGLQRWRAPQLLLELAGLMQETGRPELAARAASQAWELNKSDATAGGLVSALLGVGRADAAQPVIDEVLRRRPFDQLFLAYRCSAARQLQLGEHRDLYDYDALVRVTDIEPPRGWSSQDAFLSDLGSVLRERHRMLSHPLGQSLRNGTQTSRSLLRDAAPEVQAFLQSLQEPLAEYQRMLQHDSTHPLCARNQGPVKLTGCWSVTLQAGGYHVNHVHPNGWLSSAFYVQVPAEAEDEVARQGWLKFGEPRYPSPGLTAQRFVQPRPGRLVLFPSYFWHGTTTLLGEESRLTVAFDAIAQIG